MKITKEKLKELAAEIIAEEGGELKEFLGLFGGGDKKTLKAMNQVANEISMGESEIKTAKRSGPEAAAKKKRNVAAALLDYAGMLEKADDKLYADHLGFPGMKSARSSEMIRSILGGSTGPEAAEKAKSYAEELDPRKSRMRENKMKITKANIKQLVAESIRDIFNENVDSPELGSETVAEQLQGSERKEDLPDMEGLAKSVDKALNLLVGNPVRLLAALHHNGAKQGTELYNLANNTLNALDRLRTAIRDEASKR